MSQRIFVMSAAVGAGHLRAAQAVELALRQLAPDAQVRNIDVLELTNAAFRRIYGRAYLDLVNKAPHVLGYIYDLMDKPSRSGKDRRDQFRLAFEKLNLQAFIDLLKEQRPDLAINTHFLPAEIIAHLRRRRRWHIPQTTVTTDFDTHRLWVNQPCEHYFTATEEGALGLAAWGVPRQTITPTGIPIHPAFAQIKERDEVLRRHALRGDRPIVLQLAGGFGVGPIGRIYTALLEVQLPLEIIVVTGRNEQARRGLETITVPPRHRVHLLGFTDQMDELMAAADLLVSKPGGLTTSEALARGLPLAIVQPTPGQEDRNSDFLLENGAAIKINNLAVLAHKVQQVLSDAPRLEMLKQRARALGRPQAAFDVVRQSLGACGST
jgi:processive 1,2-diacylglycerol beta-glucosyltransferase